MWIQECLKLYEGTVERFSGKLPDPGRLERALAGAKAKGQVGPKELQLIVESSDFPYLRWWPELSKQFERPIPIPQKIDSRPEKKKAVSRLQKRLKHIEVVSIILRFLFPKEFGIISPPVIGLLNLVPSVPDKDNVGQYLRYLDVLGELRLHYRQRTQFRRIADFDMALWTAAQLQWREQKHEAILEMHQDNYFQEIRLNNLLESLGEHWSRTLRERLLLARALLRYDPVVAAVIVARCYEKIIRKVGDQVGCEIRIAKHPHIPVPKQLERLAKNKEVRRREVSLADLDLWGFRKDAVHGEENRKTGESREISKRKAEKFLKGVEKLNKDLEELLP